MDKSIDQIAQEYLPYMKILEQAGSFAVFLSDRFGQYYYVTEYIEASQEINIEKLVHPDDWEVVRRIDKKVWELLDTLPEEEKLTYKYIYEMRVLDRGKYVRMIYQMRILAFKDDNFLGMGIIDIAPEQSANTSVRFQIKNCLTDEIVRDRTFCYRKCYRYPAHPARERNTRPCQRRNVQQRNLRKTEHQHTYRKPPPPKYPRKTTSR